jgi:uncharacterized membrane protein
MLITSARWVNLFLTGLVAGILVSFWMVEHGLRELAGPVYTAVHQPVNRVFGPVMPPLMTLAIFSGLAVLALLARAYKTWGFTLTAIGTLCSFAVAMSSLLVNVPINQEVLAWSPAALPDDWMQLRDRWWLWHNVRTILSTLGFGSQILAALIQVHRSRLRLHDRTQALDATRMAPLI